jgi:hypothetical protein
MIACLGNCASNSIIKPSASFAIQHKTKHDKGKNIKTRLSKYTVLEIGQRQKNKNTKPQFMFMEI